MTDKALTLGAHHIGLAVPDLHAARAFFCDALGYRTVGEVPDYPAVFVSDGTTLITLWQVEDPATARAFDRRKNIGLHHLALAVADEAALQRDPVNDLFWRFDMRRLSAEVFSRV